jgi:DNA-binding CsgD family transcriptional regulator
VALIAMHRGDFTTHNALLDHRDASLGSRYWGFCRLSAQGLRWEQDGRADRALDALLHAWDRSPMRCLAPDLARLAGVTGQGARLRPVADAMDAQAEQHPGPHVRAAARVCRGLVDGDPAAVLAGADRYRDAGRPLYAGQGYENAAALLAEAGDTVAAKRALDSAVECFERLGATFDRSRAEDRLRRAGVRRRHVRTRPKTGWDALTETERKIAAFVADGWSNPDIATTLFLSRRTVRNHVSHILAKLGMGSRVELAVYAYDHRSE